MSCSFPLGLSKPVNGLARAEIDLQRGMERDPCINSQGRPPSLVTGFNLPILSAWDALDGATWVWTPASFLRPLSLGSGVFLFQEPRSTGLRGLGRVWGTQPPCRHPAVPSDLFPGLPLPSSPLPTLRPPAALGGKWQSSLQRGSSRVGLCL